MRWDPSHSSPDVVDRRGQGGGRGLGGLLSILPFLLRSPFGIVILVAVIGFVAVRSCIGAGVSSLHGGAAGQPGARTNDEVSHFVGFVLDDVQGTWEKTLAAEGKSYRHAKLVLFTDGTSTGCGYGESAMGPFYCPNDERVYLDVDFFRELDHRFGAPGEFAQAYVIAHEIGHHVQKILGVGGGEKSPTKGAAGSSVRLELQADCYAGIWAHSTEQRDLLEEGDLKAAIDAAAAIGDDRLQSDEQGKVTPESFTHGTSAQRVRWFERGEEQGTLDACDTFAATSL